MSDLKFFNFLNIELDFLSAEKQLKIEISNSLIFSSFSILLISLFSKSISFSVLGKIYSFSQHCSERAIIKSRYFFKLFFLFLNNTSIISFLILIKIISKFKSVFNFFF